MGSGGVPPAPLSKKLVICFTFLNVEISTLLYLCAAGNRVILGGGGSV